MKYQIVSGNELVYRPAIECAKFLWHCFRKFQAETGGHGDIVIMWRGDFEEMKRKSEEPKLTHGADY